MNNTNFIIDDSRDWNEQQLSAIHLALQRKSFVLTGAAGTGKTSTLKGIINSLMLNAMIPPVSKYRETKVLRGGMPAMALCSYTNAAVRQIAKHFTGDIPISTLHKLLEYAPEYETVTKEDGDTYTRRVFLPQKNRFNRLPPELSLVVLDESGTISQELIELLFAALVNPKHVQFILLGDINQLPSVYGGPILAKGLLDLPVIELNQVYRQALESPIISLATHIKEGKPFPIEDKVITMDNGVHGKVTIRPWSTKTDDEVGLTKAIEFMKIMAHNNLYNELTDTILCPQNVNFGTVELNKGIAQYLGLRDNRKVHQIIAGYNKYYYAIGDKVLCNKRESIIIDIKRNPKYAGKRPIDTSAFEVDRYGAVKPINTQEPNQELELDLDLDLSMEEASSSDVETDQDEIINMLTSISNANSMEEILDRTEQCSHEITVRYINGQTYEQIQTWKPEDQELSKDEDSDFESSHVEFYKTTTSKEVNDMSFGYAMTVHKSQGSEWNRVYCLFHNTHGQMISRELVYTAITRAAKELVIVCEPDRRNKPGTLTKAALSPRIKGTTIEEKLEYLKNRLLEELKESGGISNTPLWDETFHAAHSTDSTPNVDPSNLDFNELP
jgi:ATP-dependent exoDNAse (exonuclease V) alpha subunit